MTLQPETQYKRSISQAESFIAQFTIQDSEFKRLQSLVYDKTAIVIKENKRNLLINRLAKRLRHLGLKTFTDYIKYVSSGLQAQSELVELIDAITTNKTDFYREIKHFHYLEQTVLPAFIQANKTNSPCKVWSSASSTGEEPYTISITLSEYFAKHTGFRFEILGTDISETVLRQCAAGIYQKIKTHPIPPHLLKKYFMPIGEQYQIKPGLAKPVSFKKLNLLQDFHQTLRGFDVIFCRNVMIYFDRDTQEKIVNKMYKVLKPGGYLFIGLSETLHGMNTEYEYVSPSIYQKAV